MYMPVGLSAEKKLTIMLLACCLPSTQQRSAVAHVRGAHVRGCQLLSVLSLSCIVWHAVPALRS